VISARACVAIVALVLACGLIGDLGCSSGSSSTSGAVDASSPDAGALLDATSSDAITEAATSNGPYPAFMPPEPQAASSGGPTMTAPKIVPIYFPGETLQSEVRTFVGQWLASNAWKQLAEYGIGAGTLVDDVMWPTPAPSMTTHDEIAASLVALLESSADGGAPEGGVSGLPQPDANTIYTLYFPATTSIVSGAESNCSGFGGYHDSTTLTNGQPVTYAVIARCTALLGTVDSLTQITSHEIIEASSDPLPGTNPAYLAVGAPDQDWSLVIGGELCDMAAGATANYMYYPGITHALARCWSNAAAASYHDPLFPALSGQHPYFNAAPVLPETIAATYMGTTQMIRGVTVGAGKTKTIDVHLFSDMPTDPWIVTAVEVNPYGGKTLSLSLDQPTGRNGSVLHLTVGVTARDPAGVSLFKLTSTLGGDEYVWVGAVSQ
jgi:hypothetical protein